MLTRGHARPPSATSLDSETVVVMLSGGIDSVFALAYLLRETRASLLVHHINLLNDEGRAEVETARCRAIVEHCRTRLRDFHFSDCTIDHRGLRFFGYDMLAVGFGAGLVTRAQGLQGLALPGAWVFGSCLEEGPGPRGRWQHVEACVAAAAAPFPAPPYLELPLRRKTAEMDYLGPELLALCWHCRRPRWTAGQALRCGACRTCMLMNALGAA